MRLTDVLRSVDLLKPGADIHYLLIRRETPPDRHVSAVSADLAAAVAAPGSAADIILSPRDRITVFDLTSSRDRIIQPLIDELRAQSDASQPAPVVHVEGKVKIPGEYPLESGMTVADLVRAGGGLSDEAFRGEAELARYQILDGSSRHTDITTIDLVKAMRGDQQSNMVLRPFDNLSVKEVSLWNEEDTITLVGEVRFPGTYAIRKGETLKSVVQRAGGLTPFAFPEGSVFTRDELKRREQEQIDLLITRTQADLANAAMVPTGATQIGTAATIAMGQSLLAQLKVAKPVGRLVIDLPRTLKDPVGSPSDVVLRDKDQLIVPRFQQQVTVIGEVQNSTSHLWTPGTSRDGYIAMSGGTTHMADKGRIYIVRANGSVVLGAGENGWFRRNDDNSIKPGDTIVVPLDTEHLPSLPFWTAVTTILYNVAIALSAIRYL
jgi:protein involved in polysaccharide export with SLBB domain